MTNRRRWLCIAYAFPPINRSGTHRTLAFVKHLSRFGWDATVLTINPFSESLDMELSSEIPRNTRIVRTRCSDFTSLFAPFVRWRKRGTHDFRVVEQNTHRQGGHDSADERAATESPKSSLTNRLKWVEPWLKQALQLPDSKIGWFLRAFPIGLRAAFRDRPDVIYSTSPYMTAHLIAMAISTITRIPWVADFRDPWTENPFREIRFASLRRIDARLESMVLRRASRIVCTTPTMSQSFASRGSKFATKTMCIPNGIDLDLWGNVKPLRVTSPDVFTFVHAGQFYGRRNPAILFDGLRQAIARQSPSTKPIRLVLAGSERFDGVPLAEIASERGVGSAVIVLGSRDHRETMSLIAGADANVLVGAEGEGADMQVPNKLFEYLGARHPILALIDQQNPAVEILNRSRADAIVCDPVDSKGLAEHIATLALNDRNVSENAWCGVEEYSRGRRAMELESLFCEMLHEKCSAPAFPPKPAILQG
ncbi:MAG: glycosyltransferase [Planctomycetes bacterium]|nr:glycosyltransferase [Planctomycetota bacterium]MBI3834940.1 glycosyltransferase [Planctomycetota bacterium]